ncbi:MAG: DUF1592 domain-containing protein [Acidimicrobiia bacterium]|nr:DUF1592 domain-containing protein [Acidimicrobiia bacterium]
MTGLRKGAIGLTVWLCVTPGFEPAHGAQEPGVTAAGAVQRAPRALLDRYCVTCHNTRLKTAGLALDALDLSDTEGSAETLEKIVRRLQTGDMPPAGQPRPEPAIARAAAGQLASALDRAAAANPAPGAPPAFRRLSRTEYRNAIRDLLALPDLPREMDVDVVLPPDNSTTGFDNLAELLFVSPTLLDGYLTVARRISRLAVGDPTIPPLVETYRFPLDLRQDEHLDPLPPGTRGGASIRTTLPLDGEYLLRVEFAGRGAGTEQVVTAIDGAEVSRVPVFGPAGRPLAEGRFLEEPLALKAGPHEIAVAFVQRLATTTELLVRPALRGRGTQPSMASVTITGPARASGPGDTPSRQRIFVCHPARGDEARSCARRILARLARLAYRGPVAAEDVDELAAFYDAGAAEGGFEHGVQQALARLLVSPLFLFRIERDPAGTTPGAVHELDDLALAARLSFFLWSSLPDDTLLDLAEGGLLRRPEVLHQQVRRMLADPRAGSLVTNFAAQWLYLRDVASRRPDEDAFQNFDEGLRQAFQRETELFLRHVLLEDRSVIDLLRADYTFVNERLAKHYGIPHVYGSHFRRVDLPADSPRKGLLGQGSILMLTSYATRTSPVLRGKWILDNLLGSPPPPPPPNVPALEESAAGDRPLTLREAMVRHRANPVCASCHARMDPLGFALEHFDAIGRRRHRSESGAPIDASGVFPDGTAFDGADGLRQALLDKRDRLVSTLTEKLLMYALGRRITHADAPAVRAIAQGAAAQDYRFSAIVLGIVHSAPFRMRQALPTAPSGVAASTQRPGD